MSVAASDLGACDYDQSARRALHRPPGIKGDGDPSGGKYAAMGEMTYYDDLASDGSWTETCLLPPDDTSLCKAILGNFDARYAKR